MGAGKRWACPSPGRRVKAADHGVAVGVMSSMPRFGTKPQQIPISWLKAVSKAQLISTPDAGEVPRVGCPGCTATAGKPQLAPVLLLCNPS